MRGDYGCDTCLCKAARRCMEESRVKRLRDARRLIALNSFAMSGPLDRETVVDAGTRSAVRQRISLATIYRTLFELTRAGIISVNHDFTGGLRGIPDESRF